MVIISNKKTYEIDLRNFLSNTHSIIVQRHPEKSVSHFLARDYMHILENDDDVVEYCEQPFKINYFFKKSIKEFIPDFYVKFSDAREEIIILNKSLIDIKEQLLFENLLQENKVNYKILQPHEITTDLMFNYKFLSNYHDKGRFIKDIDIQIVCKTVDKFKRLTVSQLLDEIGKTFERKAEILYVTWYLIYGKILKFNKEEKLSLNTIIWN